MKTAKFMYGYNEGNVISEDSATQWQKKDAR